ncbi:MAG TPA: TonB-dependent receptor [Bacteroidetes bacterium]|nr:TonB-dependent receptor [Bacteroidota bacterium]
MKKNSIDLRKKSGIPYSALLTKKLTVLFVALFCPFLMFGQNLRISGTVTDANGEPVVGVTIVEKGTTHGTITNEDGQYVLENVPGDAVLVFSFVGMITQEIPVEGRTVINVELQEQVIGLEELVVVGYGVQKKATLTGATAVVNNEDLAVSPTPTLSQAVVGKAPGVMARQADGRPGKAAYIQIRNMGTPLYVIDGIPATEEDFNNLDVNSIEDMSILKDASAAIYGIRASNGVVLITTKKGKTGESNKINVNTYYGWQNWTRFPRPADAGTFVFAKATADVNRTMASTGTGSTSWTQEDLEHWRLQDTPDHQGTDWYEFAVVKNAPQQYFNINTTGGTENTTYYIAVSRLNQDGNFTEYNFNRTNLQTNVESRIRESITVGARISAQINNTNSPAAPGDVMWNPMYGLYRNYPTWRPYANDNPDYVNHTDWDESHHALFRKDIIGYYEQIYRSMNSVLYAEYQTPLEGLTARVQYSFRANQGNYDRFQYTYNTYTYDPETDMYNVTGGLSSGSHSRNSTLRLGNVYQAQLNYANTFGQHSIAATYVFEAQDNESPSNLSVSSKPSSNYLELIQFAELTGFSNTWSAGALMGHVGRINYDYADKYILELSGRYDASYIFPPGERWGLFPSVSAGWRISEESFFQNSALGGIFKELKLRGSYGMMGNDSPGGYGAFDYLAGYDYNSGSQVFDGNLVVGTALRDPGTTNITWAKAYVTDIGIDISMLDGALSAEFDVFRRDMKGLSAQRYDVLIPEEVNIILPYENLEADRHEGLDGLVRYRGRSGDFTYNVAVNVGYSRSKTLDVYKPRFGNSWDEYRSGQEGRYKNITWMYECIGQFQSMDEINNYPVNIDGRGNTTLLPGDLIYKDVNDDGVIDGYDMRPLGYPYEPQLPWGWGNPYRNALPGLNYGLTFNVTWKGFDLNVAAQGGALTTFIAEWELRNPLQGMANSAERLLDDAWHMEDIYNPSDDSWVPGFYPAVRPNMAYHSNGNKSSTFWSRNVKYLRFRNIDLGYTLPSKWVNRIGIQRMRVYANGYNLFSIDNLKDFGIDPELATTSGLQYPQSKIINVGVNVTF